MLLTSGQTNYFSVLQHYAMQSALYLLFISNFTPKFSVQRGI